MVTIVPVVTERDKLRFIKSQWLFYKDDPCFVPPLIHDRKRVLNQKKNPFFTHASMQLWMAVEGDVVVGRIGAIINQSHNRLHNDTVGFFGFFECINRQDVANTLFDTAAKWLRERDMTVIRGPVNPSINDEVGMLVEGFNDPPRALFTYNPSYYPALVEGYGFVKAKDLWTWKITGTKVMSPRLERAADMVQKRSRVTIRTLNMKRLASEVDIIKDIYNRAWEPNWGFVPLTDAEIDFMAVDLKTIVNPKIVFFAEIDGKPIGFSLSIPDVNQVLRTNKRGHLLPALPKLMFGLKKTTWARIIILGVLPEYQGRGIDALMYYFTAKESAKCGITHGEAGWILEDNEMMKRGAAMMGGEKFKTYRVYEKPIS